MRDTLCGMRQTRGQSSQRDQPGPPQSTREAFSERTAAALPRLLTLLRATITSVLEHDALNIAQAAAYSSLVSLFPALIVSAAIITWLPDNASIRFQAALFFDRILPPDVSPLLESYFENGHRTHQSTEAILIAAVVSLVGASGVIVTLMEGFRRAFGLSPDEWSFWERRWRSLALVPIALFPLVLASLIIIFGHVITEWLAAPFAALLTERTLHTAMLGVVILLRWTIALASSVGVIAAIYHMGVPPFCLGVETDTAPVVATGDHTSQSTPVYGSTPGTRITPGTQSAPGNRSTSGDRRIPGTRRTPGKSNAFSDTFGELGHLVRSVHTSVQSSVESTLPTSVHRSMQSSVSTIRAMSTMERSWTRTLPGAALATMLWFFITMAFGWYVTRFANYSEVYGSLGVGIALLFWLFILSLSILVGAEFNAHLYPPVHTYRDERAEYDYPSNDPELFEAQSAAQR